MKLRMLLIAGLLTCTTTILRAERPDCELPTISIKSPTTTQNLWGSQSFEALATDNKAVDHVELFIDGKKYANDEKTAPYLWAIDLTMFTEGNHTFHFVAYDTSENPAETSETTFTVKKPVVPTPTPTLAPTPSPVISAQGVDDSCKGFNPKVWHQDANGWTVFPTPTKSIYVNAAGLLPPGAPAGSVAVKNMTDLTKILQANTFTGVYFKRGEQFQATNLDGHLSGLDFEHPMIFGSYGSGPRPKLIFTGPYGLVVISAGANVAFVDLELDGYQSQGADGIRLVQHSGANILIEGLKIGGFQNNINADMQSGPNNQDATPVFQNLVIRRSVIVDAYSRGPGHSQGLYMSKIMGLTVEENYIDHNGWKNNGKGEADRTQGGFGAPTIFNHNLYLQSEGACTIFRNNVSSRGSATGLQARHGGVIENNLFAFNPNQLNFGAVNGDSVFPALHILPGISGRVVGNVLIDPVNITPSLPRGGESTIGNILHAVVADNLVVRQGESFTLRGFANGIGIHNLLFKGNIEAFVKTPTSPQGEEWGVVVLKAETLPHQVADPKTGVMTTVSTLAASVFSPNGVRMTPGYETGIKAEYAPMSISDTGTVLDGNIFQTSATTFWNPLTPPKPYMQFKNMQKANVSFVNPGFKIDDSYIDSIRNMDRPTWNINLLASAMNAKIKAAFTPIH